MKARRNSTGETVSRSVKRKIRRRNAIFAPFNGVERSFPRMRIIIDLRKILQSNKGESVDNQNSDNLIETWVELIGVNFPFKLLETRKHPRYKLL